MNISLPRAQREWLEAEVAAGRFNSIEDAIATAIAGLMSADADDLAWARPLVEQARISVERGDVISGEDFFRRLKDKLNALRSE